ncbi:MAG TPA: hypothetical protein VHG91_17025 [Longimicrobium sp.]|nr:hypothetical protein [Longimicrobium sp.]
MKPLVRLLAAALALAAAACGDATGPAHAALVGAWATAPHAAFGPDGRALGLRQHTLRIDARGGFAWEDATVAPTGAVLTYAKTLGRVEAVNGTLRFHPSGVMRYEDGPGAAAALADTHLVPEHPYGWRVARGRLLVREPGGGTVAFVRVPKR